MQNKEIKYTQQQIQNILDILNDIDIKGITNMNRIIAIVGILNEPFLSSLQAKSDIKKD